MEFVPAVALAALTLKLIDFLRYLRAGDINGVFTQLITWIAGVAGLLLAAQTTWADGIQIGDQPLSKLGFWSVVFAGVTVASGASAAKDALKAVDTSNTAKIPTLLRRSGRPVDTTDVG